MNYSYIEYINLTVSMQVKGFGVFQEPLIKLTFGWSFFQTGGSTYKPSPKTVPQVDWPSGGRNERNHQRVPQLVADPMTMGWRH